MCRFLWRRRPAGVFAMRGDAENRRRDAGATKTYVATCVNELAENVFRHYYELERLGEWLSVIHLPEMKMRARLTESNFLQDLKS
jgi:hypothetical protein